MNVWRKVETCNKQHSEGKTNSVCGVYFNFFQEGTMEIWNIMDVSLSLSFYEKNTNQEEKDK